MAVGRKGGQIVKMINFVFACLGILIIAGGLYVYFYDWGPADRTFIQGPCVFIVLFGTTAFLTSFIGHQGLYYRNQRKGCCTGFNILCLYICILVVLAIAEVLGLVYSNILVKTLQTSYDLGDISFPTFSSTEKYISQLFNGVFFANSNGLCTAITSIPFWGFIDAHCPSQMQSHDCKKCAEFGVGNCPADQNTCYADSIDNGPTCPYIICRSGVLKYLLDKTTIFQYGLLGLAIFQIMLICIVFSLVVHYNSKKKRWSIIKVADNRQRQSRVAPDPSPVPDPSTPDPRRAASLPPV